MFDSRVRLQAGTVAPVFKLRHMATPGGTDEATGTRPRRPKRYLRQHGHPAAQPGHGRSTAHLPTRKLLHAQSPTLFFSFLRAMFQEYTFRPLLAT